MNQPSISPRLAASCRIALAAYLHDLGKFAERARLEVSQDRLDSHVTQYCPYHQAGGRGWHTHRHAAYTALAWDIIEHRFPNLVGDDVSPFAARSSTTVDDSLVNAAARHHKPDTFLQWIVATADRVASGFEREEFEAYNAAEDKTREGRNHYTARQLTLFEQIRPAASASNGDSIRKGEMKYRYPLRPMSVNSLFPLEANGYETADDAAAQAEYRRLWDSFVEGLDAIPDAHRAHLPLWLDNFDSAWGCYTHTIPAATAFGTRPEVSLYDHSRTAAAIATALWRFHHDREDDSGKVRNQLADRRRPDWDEPKLLLIQGDFFGIQEFIFASGGDTQKKAARLLRGRSFYISLLTECAALRVLETLDLPPTSQVTNAAGKFLIVAPNTPETLDSLKRLQDELDRWFLDRCYGQSGIGLASTSASCNDFLPGPGGEDAPFGRLMVRLFEQLQEVKSRRFELCSARAPEPLFDGYLDRFDPDFGPCRIDGHSPATIVKDGVAMCDLSADQVDVGRFIAHKRTVVVTSAPEAGGLRVPIFGYGIRFAGDPTANDDRAVGDRSAPRREWDFRLPESGDAALFNGLARRFINGYVPLFENERDWTCGRYDRLPDELSERPDSGSPKTLEHIACDALAAGESGWRGTTALMTLKGDVDDLGAIFQSGFSRPTFAKMAALSRQLNAFFTVWLPWHCASKRTSTYTIFAGGDDFFLVGPWRSTLELAREMNSSFARYVACNPAIHFSAGLSMSRPGLPIRQLAALSDEALDRSKQRSGNEGRILKNAVTCFGHTLAWDELGDLMATLEKIEQAAGELNLSTGYLYGLQYLADMAGRINTGTYRVDDALWRSRFAYRTRRMLERQRGMSDSARADWQRRLGEVIGANIGKYGGAFNVALFTFLYQNRQ